MIHTVTITGANGVPFLIRYLPTGSAYGRGNVLTIDGPALVEFYDMRYPDGALSEDVAGQFVSRYYVGTLLEPVADIGGLCLDGGNRDQWSIDAEAYRVVRAWLRLLAERDHDSASYRERFPARPL